tara:strand:- start:1131 stop:1250 length:120 start_codon:yes stop_codon:yes gene_type:complete
MRSDKDYLLINYDILEYVGWQAKMTLIKFNFTPNCRDDA